MDFLDFLDEIDRQAEPGLAVHVICDNLSAHKAPVVTDRPRERPPPPTNYAHTSRKTRVQDSGSRPVWTSETD
ncbi:hypothetical protein [Streptomyces sp. NPDC060002]|uniref:hypothetical protein n=1 Tax=Streptomyces sp. NPDC060002 TaxID=3347033 RepID=UPI0036BA2E70